VAFLFLPTQRAKTAREQAPWRKTMSRKVQREEIMTIIKELAAKLGHVPSVTELTKQTKVTRRQIRNNFGTYMRALKDCDLARNGGGHKVGMDPLFRDWARGGERAQESSDDYRL
jgi:HNH endonuclease